MTKSLPAVSEDNSGQKPLYSSDSLQLYSCTTMIDEHTNPDIGRHITFELENVVQICRDPKTGETRPYLHRYAVSGSASGKNGVALLVVDTATDMTWLKSSFRVPIREELDEAFRGYTDKGDNCSVDAMIREFGEEAGQKIIEAISNDAQYARLRLLNEGVRTDSGRQRDAVDYYLLIIDSSGFLNFKPESHVDESVRFVPLVDFYRSIYGQDDSTYAKDGFTLHLAKSAERIIASESKALASVLPSIQKAYDDRSLTADLLVGCQKKTQWWDSEILRLEEYDRYLNRNREEFQA